MLSLKHMNQEEYYKQSEDKGLPSRCPILNRCERRAWTMYFNSYLESDPNVNVHDFLIKNGDLPAVFKHNHIQLQGEGPMMNRGESHYFYNHFCPEVNLFDDSHRLLGQRELASSKGEWDSYYEKDKHRALEFKHYSNCAEFSFHTYNESNKTKLANENMMNTNNNMNNNVNNNVNHINVNMEIPNASTVKKETKPNWYKRLIIGGFITTLLSVSGYYFKKKIDEKASVSPATIQTPIEGKKQN